MWLQKLISLFILDRFLITNIAMNTTNSFSIYNLIRQHLYARKNCALCIFLLALCSFNFPVWAQSLQDVKSALSKYDIAEAHKLINRIESNSNKGRKKQSVPEELSSLKQQYEQIASALDRIQKIEVIDSITLNKADFYQYIPLSISSGKFLSPTQLAQKIETADSSAVFVSADGSSMLWGSKTKGGRMQIMESFLLSDGNYSTPTPIQGDFGEGDINWPWLSPDGITLFFASKNSESSLGGYDIFMTRKEDGKFLTPQNIGMPFNSYGNDYLYVIDEEKGLGWWATDRVAPTGKVTLYTFIPTELRVNYPPETPGLSSLALLQSIKATQIPGKDYQSLLNKAKKTESVHQNVTANCRIAIPGHGVITEINQLINPQAKELFQDLSSQVALLQEKRNRLDSLRYLYASGDTTHDDEILKLENSIEQEEHSLMLLQNEIIRVEQSATN